MGSCSSSGKGGSSYSDNWRDHIQFKDHDSFFGDICNVSNKYFIAKSFNPSEDEAIILTRNVIAIKGSPVLVTDNDKVVYLKKWNVELVRADIDGGYMRVFAVKLNKKYFKEYAFKKPFENFAFGKNDRFTFEKAKELAKSQEKERYSLSKVRGSIEYNYISDSKGNRW